MNFIGTLRGGEFHPFDLPDTPDQDAVTHAEMAQAFLDETEEIEADEDAA